MNGKVVRGQIYQHCFNGYYLIPKLCYGPFWYGEYVNGPFSKGIQYLGRKSSWIKLSKEQVKKLKLELL